MRSVLEVSKNTRMHELLAYLQVPTAEIPRFHESRDAHNRKLLCSFHPHLPYRSASELDVPADEQLALSVSMVIKEHLVIILCNRFSENCVDWLYAELSAMHSRSPRPFIP